MELAIKDVIDKGAVKEVQPQGDQFRSTLSWEPAKVRLEKLSDLH